MDVTLLQIIVMVLLLFMLWNGIRMALHGLAHRKFRGKRLK